MTWLSRACILTILLAGTPSTPPLTPLPGAPPMDPALAARIQATLRARGSSYRPEAAQRNPDGSPRYTNRLILETSPYLIQHAHNPVDWRPWGEAAFEAAQRLDRPVLLSVGYSTCHWCHVMERESFEDEEIARYLNENFIAIKVDREERPDVDSIYMSAVSALTGGGGWPMTVWLTPKKEPFYGGTYFPARDGDRGTATGFLTILRKTREAYHRPGSTLQSSARDLAQSLKQALTAPPAGELPSEACLRKATETYQGSFDQEQGGIRGAPKFPATFPIRLLLRQSLRDTSPQLRSMAVLTLERMAAGGIRDQIGGGFHRYSTDSRWRVPHFEKMLYDNALLALDYLEAFRATSRQEFAGTARDILVYLERDMMSPEGAFYGATDADSLDPAGNPTEGWFYTWTPDEVLGVLGAQRSRVVLPFYGIAQGEGASPARSVPYQARTVESLAKDVGLAGAQVQAALESSRQDLYRARLKRPAPRRDEKILTAWNGLALSALAQAGLTLGDEAYLRQADTLADLLMQRGFQGGRLRRNLMADRARQDAFLPDYACLIAGLLDLYEATGNVKRLRQAQELDAVLEKHYEDAQRGGFFLTADDAEALLVRQKPSEDGAEPSGNSVQALNLLRLAELTGEERYQARAERTLGAFGSLLTENPTSLPEMLLAMDFLTGSRLEIVLVAPARLADTAPFLERLRKVYAPHRVLVQAVQGQSLQEASALVPLLTGKTALRGKATAYICRNRACRLPTTDPARFEEQLRQLVNFGDNGAVSTGRGARGKP